MDVEEEEEEEEERAQMRHCQHTWAVYLLLLTIMTFQKLWIWPQSALLGVTQGCTSQRVQGQIYWKKFDLHLNNIYKFSSYLIANTLLLSYKDQ
jgi:hypothetical protein